MKRVVLGLSLLAGCVSPPIDVYPAAARAVDEGQLLRALAYLDQIPPAHPQYPDARMLAQAVERRLRRSQELLLQGLELRAQWRDEEALHCFEESQAIWAAAVGVDAWIEATRSRIQAARLASAPPAAGEIKTTEPVPTAVVEAPPGPQPSPEAERPSAVVDPAESPAQAVGPLVQVPVPAETGPKRTPQTLAQIERLIEAGDLQTALDELDLCLAANNADEAVRQRLVRVLHQRALQSYGRGWLDVAIADWTRLLAIEGAHPQARSFLQAATAEHQRRTSTPATPPK